MQVKFWGVRGSFPQTSAKYQIYGGNTSCVSIELQDAFVVFDGGTGLAEFGKYWMEGVRKPIHIFFGHAHMDHLMGLFSFQPFFEATAEIHLYGEAKFGMSFREQIENVMQPCYWPVAFAQMPANIRFHDVSADQNIYLNHENEISNTQDMARVGGANTDLSDSNADWIYVQTTRGYHPGSSLIYKLKQAEKTIVYALDCELTDAAIDKLAPFMQGADMLIADTHFSEEDYETHRGWGHSTVELQMQLAKAAEINKVVFMHYAIEYDDRKLTMMENKFRGTRRNGIFAREGMILEV